MNLHDQLNMKDYILRAFAQIITDLETYGEASPVPIKGTNHMVHYDHDASPYVVYHKDGEEVDRFCDREDCADAIINHQVSGDYFHR